MRSIGMTAMVLGFAACITMADDGSNDSLQVGKVHLTGTVQYVTGEIRNAGLNYFDLDGNRILPEVWWGHSVGTLNFSDAPYSWLQVRTGFEFRQYINMIPASQVSDKEFGNFVYYNFYVREAQGIISIIKNRDLSLDVEIGAFPYKYTPSNNLGEYLFRSGTYPFFLLSEFDRPFADLTGLRVGFSWGGDDFKIKLDQMALTERQIPPFYDISLATMLDIDCMKFINFGGGIDFDRCIPVDSRLETYPNASLITKDQYVTSNGDTGYYTFQGTKVATHVTVDPIGPIRDQKGPLQGLMGSDGLKLYGELSVIGWEDYPANESNPYGYSERSQRMPWMVGLDLPAWKLLDVFSVELEHWPSPYPNGYDEIMRFNVPVSNKPSDGAGDPADSAYWTNNYAKNHWYWSVYMKKALNKHFEITLQLARDHTDWEIYPMLWQNYNFEEVMRQIGSWGWTLKAAFLF